MASAPRQLSFFGLLGLLPVFAMAAADIGGAVYFSSGSNLIPPNSIAHAVAKMTNYGPDAVVSVASGTSFLASVGFRAAAVFAVEETAPCRIAYTDFIAPPSPALLVVSINPRRGLGVGDSVTCIVGITTYPEAPPRFIQRFSFSSERDDPNPGNNSVEVDIITAPVAVPTLSARALYLMATLLYFGALRSVHSLGPIFRQARKRGPYDAG